MKKSMIVMLTAGTMVASCFHLSCTDNDKTQNTGASSDTPSSFGNPPPAASEGSRGTRSAAEMDSVRAASKDTAETVGKDN